MGSRSPQRSEKHRVCRLQALKCWKRYVSKKQWWDSGFDPGSRFLIFRIKNRNAYEKFIRILSSTLSWMGSRLFTSGISDGLKFLSNYFVTMIFDGVTFHVSMFIKVFLVNKPITHFKIKLTANRCFKQIYLRQNCTQWKITFFIFLCLFLLLLKTTLKH